MIPDRVINELSDLSLDYTEDYLEQLLDDIGRFNVYWHTKNWVQHQNILFRHGTRLDHFEIEDVRSRGLKPLLQVNYRDYLIGLARETVPTDRLHDSISKLLASYEQHLNRDHNAVFFSISGRSLLWRPLAHYLYYGSEFINIVLGESCGAKAKDLHRHRTKPVLVCYEFAGNSLSKIVDETALEDVLKRGNIPELEHLFLSLWLFWRRKGSLEKWYPPVDFTHVHRGALPNGGIPTDIEFVDECQIGAPDWRLGI